MRVRWGALLRSGFYLYTGWVSLRNACTAVLYVATHEPSKVRAELSPHRTLFCTPCSHRQSRPDDAIHHLTKTLEINDDGNGTHSTKSRACCRSRDRSPLFLLQNARTAMHMHEMERQLLLLWPTLERLRLDPLLICDLVVSALVSHAQCVALSQLCSAPVSDRAAVLADIEERADQIRGPETGMTTHLNI
jgi:hypothetical protein